MTSVLLNFLFGFSFFILKKNLAFGKNLILFKNIVKGFFHMEFFLSGYIIFLLLDTINPGKRITAPLFNDILCCWKFENKKGDTVLKGVPYPGLKARRLQSDHTLT